MILGSVQGGIFMNVYECLENGAINELINFSFDEVKKVFNRCAYYVPEICENQFVNEATAVKTWYQEESEKIEKYKQEEYRDLLSLREDIPEYDTPEYMEKGINVQTKRKLVQLIKKYFDKGTFEKYKHELYGLGDFKEEAVETPHELLVALNMNKDRIYSLLSIIGHYQYHRGYFLSWADRKAINQEYTAQVHRINKNLGMEFRVVDIFFADRRLKPSKNNKEKGVSESYQSNKFIDVDKFSLIMLIQPYLKHNTQELCKIIEIMMRNFRGRYSGVEAWMKTQEEVGEFISECESRGIMKRLY